MGSKKFYLTLTLLAAFSSVFVACGRRNSDDVRIATRGNVALEGGGVVSGSTLEGLGYYLKVHRIFSVRNGYATGMQTGYMGCTPANNVYGTAVGSAGIYADIQVNGICKTFAIPNSPGTAVDADLGIEVSMTCDNSYVCEMAYINIVGRNPAIYSSNQFQGNLVPIPGGGLGYATTGTAWTMQADTEVKQVGVLKSISQDRIMSAIEIQTKYSQRMRPEQLMLELQRTSQEFYRQ